MRITRYGTARMALRALRIGMNEYYAIYKELPPLCFTDIKGVKTTSWRLACGFRDAKAPSDYSLYDSIDNARNAKYSRKTHIMHCVDWLDSPVNATVLAIKGPNTAFSDENRAIGLHQLNDRLLIGCIVPHNKSSPNWMAPGDLVLDDRTPLELGDVPWETVQKSGGSIYAWFTDGTVLELSTKVPKELLLKLADSKSEDVQSVDNLLKKWIIR